MPFPPRKLALHRPRGMDECCSTDDEGGQLASRVHYRGAVVDRIECARPIVFQALPEPPPSP